MDSAASKRARATAKGMFTKARNNLLRVMDNSVDIEIVESRFAEVQRRYSNTQEKHEEHLSSLDESDETLMQAEEEWIGVIDKQFDETEEKKISYVREKSSYVLEKDKKDEFLQVESTKNHLLAIRKVEESAFWTMFKNISKIIESQMEANLPIIDIVKEEQSDLKRQLETCKQAHHKYTGTLHEIPSTEIEWLTQLQEQMGHINSEVVKLVKTKEDKIKNVSNIRLERIKMPKFDGDIRDYPRFKNDFARQVAPELRKDAHAAAYVLKSCLSKVPFEIIRNVDDDIDEMWKRLDEKYGKASKLTDAVMSDIKKMRPVREGDNRRFVELVDVVERGFRDLARLNLEKEMSNSTAVSLIEDKLPRDIRKLWALEVSKVNSKVKDDDKFPSLLEFLLEQKRAIEYDTNDLRIVGSVYGGSHYFEGNNSEAGSRCIIHNETDHKTQECDNFLTLSSKEKVDLIRKHRMCYSCLEIGHKSSECRNKKRCNNDGCTRNHHASLHQGMIEGVNYHTMGSLTNQKGACLLQLMSIKSTYQGVKPLTVFFDGGATISLITFNKAAMMNLHGTEVAITVTKVGGKQEKMMSFQYSLPLVDLSGEVVEFQVYGIDKISAEVKSINVEDVIHLFSNIKKGDLKRPVGEIDVLIGFEYAGFHPVREQSSDHLLIMSNRFGKCIGGWHDLLQEGTRKIVQHVVIHHLQKVEVKEFYNTEGIGIKVNEESNSCKCSNYPDVETLNHFRKVNVEDFYNVEVMGVDSNPKCGGCKCGNCPLGGKSYSLKEERELRLIEEGLQHVRDHWIARYPWKRNPSELPDNKSFAINMLKSLEKRLLKNPAHAKVYQQQIEDMLARDVARKLTEKEIEEYKGPTYYISHHEVLRPDSISTPCRIVFNSSAKFGNHVLNDYWVKGPDLINNLLGILIRFREGEVALTGDIKKMYHAVKITELDQHTHRFLWRDLKVNLKPSTYVMTSVSFGDKPAGNIAMIALRKTAEMGRKKYPEAADVIIRNSYVDDIVDSVDSQDKADQLKKEIDELIKPGGFVIKQWSSSSNIRLSPKGVEIEDKIEEMVVNDNQVKHKFETEKEEVQKILGLRWDPEADTFIFDIHLNFSPKIRNLRTGPDLDVMHIQSDFPVALTKRMILSQINGIYDPLGLVSPFTVRAKILMRKLWCGECKVLNWDDHIPQENLKEWIKFFKDLFELNDVSFKRCVKPANAVGNPSIIIFSDGSDNAYGACAFVRWQNRDGSFESNLIASKNRVTPLHRMTIVRSELCGAVLAKRLKNFILKETRFQFAKEYFVVDSQIVRGMIQRESYGFNTFVAVRIGEIQEGTDPNDWYWVDGKHNIADWLTRGKTPKELDESSRWQKGADFLKQPESEWPLKKHQCAIELPEQIKPVMTFEGRIEDTLACRININRYSEYNKLIRVTAHILAMYQKNPKPSFRNISREVKAEDFEKAEIFWYLDAQTIIKEQMRKGELIRFYPQVREDGVVVVGGRAEKWMQITYDNTMLILLPYKHRLSQLYAEHVHKEGGHLGVSATTSKIRSRVWITNVRKIVKSITQRCVPCKRKNKEFQQQVMAPLPVERLKPSPAWYATSLDFFGPIEVRGEVNKRSRGKVYGVLFNCLSSRAVHVDIAPDYTTEGLLMVLRRFVSIRGYPAKLFSDPGSQLVSASKELKDVVKRFDQIQLAKFGVEKGLEWKFSPADGPWQNGCAESLIKSVKRAIVGAIGKQILTVAEMQTVCYEAANLLNERPIGRHPTDPNDGVYLCPNHLLLGRASVRVPSGPFRCSSNPSHRFLLVENLVDSFWRQWTRDYFPSLLIRQKWHVDKRNVEVGDIVIVYDSKLIRGHWKLARVSKVYPSDDRKVRKVELEYKNQKPGEQVNKYSGTIYTRIERPVQRLIVIVPVEKNGQ